MLHGGGLTNPCDWKAHLKAQLSIPEAHSWPRWLAWLMNWVVLQWRFRHSTLPRMSNPCPSLTLIDKESAELERLLGPPFRCRSLQYFGPSSIESHLKSVSSKSTVYLLPLQFLRGLTLQQLIQTSRKQLRSSGHRVCEVAYPPLQKAYIESLTMAIREAIIEQARETKYGVLLLLQSQPQNWKTMPENVHQEAEQLKRMLCQELGGQPPIILAQPYGAPSINQSLEIFQHAKIETLIVCPFGTLISDGELDAVTQTKIIPMAKEHGISKTIQISMPKHRTTFFRVARTLIYRNAEELVF